MKIKPDDIEIPHDDPFRHDLLDRKQSILILTNLLQNLETPYTMSIDASWGNGKTTFLNIWKQHLENEDFPVVSFNAWDTDFAEYPLIALTSELLNTLQTLDDDGDLGLDAIEATLPRIHKIALTKTIPWMISLAGVIGGIQANDPSVALLGNTLSAGMAGTMEEMTRVEHTDDPTEPFTYIEAKEAINSFRNALANTAEILSDRLGGKPLVIAVDELDRCRPSYAVELLEVVKHFFSVNNVVFVLAIDKTQLTHAIKAIYGTEFDAIGYLRRFIDLDFRLPAPDRTRFMKDLMNQTLLQQFFEDYPGHSWGESDDTQLLLRAFLNLPSLSLRQIQQTMHRLGLVLASLDSPSTNICFGAIAVLVILKTIDPEVYHQFIQSDMTDKEVSDKLFDKPGLQVIRTTREGSLFDALLAMGYCEFFLANSREPTLANSGEPKLDTNSLFHHYYHIIESMGDFPVANLSPDMESPSLTPHEIGVLNHFRTHFLMFNAVKVGNPVGFNLTVKRLELFSDDLSGNNS
ncbi:MAG: P-loop NTPase fold protein [Caldilineaceae bacterium]|nr:P-loop NTPase fold protein [Caldilineaceae bacterium]